MFPSAAETRRPLPLIPAPRIFSCGQTRQRPAPVHNLPGRAESSAVPIETLETDDSERALTEICSGGAILDKTASLTA